jgi:hypothetical protein
MEKIMEKIMHKTNTSKFGHGTFEDRPFDDAELNAVTGGFEYTERTLGGPDTRPAFLPRLLDCKFVV